MPGKPPRKMSGTVLRQASAPRVGNILPTGQIGIIFFVLVPFLARITLQLRNCALYCQIGLFANEGLAFNLRVRQAGCLLDLVHIPDGLAKVLDFPCSETDDDGNAGVGYLATSDEISGLVTQGRTVTETLEISRDVARRLLAVQVESQGWPVLRKTGDAFDYPLAVSGYVRWGDEL